MAEQIVLRTKREELPKEGLAPALELERLAGAARPVWERRSDGLAFALAFASPKRLMAGESNRLAVWEVDGDGVRTAEKWGGGLILSAPASKSGVFVVRDAKSQVALWSAEKLAPVKDLGKPGDGVRGLAITPDGRAVATMGIKGTVVVWNDQGGQVGSLESKVSNPRGIGLTPDGRRVLVVGGALKEKATRSEAAVIAIESKEATARSRPSCNNHGAGGLAFAGPPVRGDRGRRGRGAGVQARGTKAGEDVPGTLGDGGGRRRPSGAGRRPGDRVSPDRTVGGDTRGRPDGACVGLPGRKAERNSPVRSPASRSG